MLPKVVLVGRMNVGKSTLFNRLSEKVKSITLDYAGVTRDFLTDTVSWKDTQFEIIDSGGISLRKSEDEITERVRNIGLSLVKKADIIVFMVDGTAGITQEEQELATFLHKQKKPILLVVNKADAKATHERLYEFYQLGFDNLYPISALHGTGIAELLEVLVELVRQAKPEAVEEKPKFIITILGKPNVGKSSLMNLLLKEERALVSQEAGTTREAITESISFYKQPIAITDTPGIRRKRGIKETLETLMVKTAFRAVERADIVLLMIDGSEAKISDQELKLAFYVFEKQYKGLIFLINKDDIMEDINRQDLAYDMEYYEFFLKKVPQLFISCKLGTNIGKILPLVDTVWQRCSQKFDDQELTMFFKEALYAKPLYSHGKLLRFFKAKQIKTAPITIILFVNHPEWFGQSQWGYLENLLRKKVNLKGAPIKWIVRKGP